MSQTAICYARKSVVLKGRIVASSPERQQANTNEKALELGLAPENYTDAEGHRSGRSEDARPEWRRARARLTDPEVAALIVDTWDRAARNVRLLLELVDECERLSVRFISCHDAIDTRTAAGRFQLSIIASVGEFESNVAGERQSATADYLRRTKGRYIGWPPFGSERVKTETDYTLLPSTKLQPNGTDHQALTHLYELRLRESFSTDSMAARINSEGWRFRDRRGQLGFWSGDRVRGVIRNHWTYAGYVVVGQSHRGDYEIIPGSHAPLLPESLTGPVAAGFGWRQRGRRTRESLDHPLTGLLICGECGERLTGEFRRGRIAYRHIVHLSCSLPYRLDGAVLEAAVREHVAGLQLPADLEQESAASVSRALLAEVQPGDVNPAHIAQSLARLQELYVEGHIERDEYDRRRADYENRARSDEQRLPASALAAVDVLQFARSASTRQFRDLAKSLYSRITVAADLSLAYEPREWCAGWA